MESQNLYSIYAILSAIIFFYGRLTLLVMRNHEYAISLLRGIPVRTFSCVDCPLQRRNTSDKQGVIAVVDCDLLLRKEPALLKQLMSSSDLETCRNIRYSGKLNPFLGLSSDFVIASLVVILSVFPSIASFGNDKLIAFWIVVWFVPTASFFIFSWGEKEFRRARWEVVASSVLFGTVISWVMLIQDIDWKDVPWLSPALAAALPPMMYVALFLFVILPTMILVIWFVFMLKSGRLGQRLF